MYDVLKIVNWMRVKNKAELIENKDAEELTQMKAMKLLYYVQGVSLVYLKHRMFPDDILAWKYGPAVSKVHQEYQGQREIVGEVSENDIDDYNELSANSKVNDVLNTRLGYIWLYVGITAPEADSQGITMAEYEAK